MDRVDFQKAVHALVELGDVDVLAKIDGLVEAYLEQADPRRIPILRRELAQEFLAAAPFTELSYRVWRRIAHEDEESYAEAYLEVRCPSRRFLPALDFLSPGE